MKNHIAGIVLGFVLAVGVAVGLAPEAHAAEVMYSTGGITVDGSPVSCEIYKIDGYNYIKLRDLAYVCDFYVGWDSNNQAVTVNTLSNYIPVGSELSFDGDHSASAVQSAQKISFDGETVSVIPVWNIGGWNFLKLSTLISDLGFTLENDNAVFTYDKTYDVSSSLVRLDLTDGPIYIREKPDCTHYQQKRTSYFSTGGCVIQQSTPSTGNTITVISGTITLSIFNLNIASPSSPIIVKSGAALTLNLLGSSSLAAIGSDNSAGIHVPAGAALTIQGNGTLSVSGSNAGAGIGGFGNGTGESGAIIINAGTVNTTGGFHGAGIGGGDNGNNGAVTINGGTVTAVGGSGAAGIGGGYCGNGGSVLINDGVITATGGIGGAGIGGGRSRDGGTITIAGGNVTSSGGQSAAGIGGGTSGNGGTTTICGGEVTAIGDDDYGAGIGGGMDGFGGAVQISNADVTASGFYAIGGGRLDNSAGCSTIEVGEGATLHLQHTNKNAYDCQERIDDEGVESTVVIIGSNALFPLTAYGHGLSYQWQESSDGRVWTDIDGQTTATAAIPMSAANDGYYYRCKLTNGWGNIVYTYPARAYVLAFTQQPQDTALNLNDISILEVVASCNNISYQWQRSFDDGSTWVDVTGEIYSTLIVNATLSENDALYRCVITATNGDQLASDAARITVTSDAITYTTRYYLERADGNGYDVVNQIVTEAEAGAGVSAPEKIFAHFTEDTGKGVHSGTVTANNSLVLSRYYDRVCYTLSYETNGGTALADVEVKYGAAIPTPTPFKMGCTFAGWYTDAALKDALNTATMPGEDLALYAKWEVVGAGRGIEYRINSITLRDGAYQQINAIPHGTFYAEASVTNLASETMDTLILATYDGNGKMLGMSFLYANPQIGQTFVLGTMLDDSAGEIAKLKAFMLPMLGGITPLAAAVEYGGQGG